ncbi:MAG TPA: hypothetical protein DEP48_02995 [Persephonella sp.]|uniref:Uncharacterized protein n=1 Tax=Persephonella marina (strain DSM 14350 / EX-H1) TaxID=123214 RepID=C0QSB3_PERMH|nr:MULTISPECIES: hypothetical protein [Persephonella]ACO03725.1 hypothetical protein PERMA_1796 [Persephonella marina EX-H1]HCB69305.1 hypothetical protein [Persephonella sp.]
MEEILQNGFSLIAAAIFATGITLILLLLIHFGILNRTLHQIKETLGNISENLNSQSKKQQETHKGKEKQNG